jgi:hypothetical protein
MSDPATTDTPVTPSSSDVIGALSSSERQNWRLTGELPKTSAVEAQPPASESDVTPESRPATPVDQAAEIAASPSPASEPGTPSKPNAETRKADLAAEILALKAERDAIRSEIQSSARRPTAPSDVSQESRPASQPVSIEQVIASPDLSRPMLEPEQFYAQFPDATVAAYQRYVARYEVRSERQEIERTQTLRQREAAFAERAAKVSPDIAPKLPPEMLAAKPLDLMTPDDGQPGVWNVAMQEVMAASDTARLLEHLAATPADLQKIAMTRSEAETIRTIAQIEARLETAPVPPPAPAGNPVSLAPAPLHTLGKKPAQPADELADAIKTGDFARYRELQNRKDLKSA